MKKWITISTILTLMMSVSFTVFAGKDLDRVMKKKMLKVSTSANWAPQSFLNEKNEMDGFDVDVAREIAKRMGVGVEFITPDWGIITAGNWRGRWDISVGSMTPSLERAKVLSFPAVYYYTPAQFTVHKTSKLNSISDLKGKRIGVATSSVYERYLQKDLKIDAKGTPPFEYLGFDVKIKSYQETNVALDDLRLGDGARLDAVLTDTSSINQAIKKKYPIKMLDGVAFYQPLAVAIDRGDKEFSDKIAEIVNVMHKDGTLTKLSQKWYGIDYTKPSEN